jgi:hypothetical protein
MSGTLAVCISQYLDAKQTVVLDVYIMPDNGQGRLEPTAGPGTKCRLVNTGPLSLSTLPLAIFNRNQQENCQRITCKKSPHN